MAHEVTGCFTGYADVQHLHLHNRGSCDPLGLLLNTDLDPPKQELSSSNTGDCWCMLAQRKRTKRFDDIYASRQIIFSNLILLFFLSVGASTTSCLLCGSSSYCLLKIALSCERRERGGSACPQSNWAQINYNAPSIKLGPRSFKLHDFITAMRDVWECWNR